MAKAKILQNKKEKLNYASVVRRWRRNKRNQKIKLLKQFIKMAKTRKAKPLAKNSTSWSTVLSELTQSNSKKAPIKKKKQSKKQKKNDKNLTVSRNPQKEEDQNETSSLCSWITLKSQKEATTSPNLTLQLNKSQLRMIEEIKQSCGVSRFVSKEKRDEAIEPSSGGNSVSKKGQEGSLLIKNESMKKDISVELKKKKKNKRKSTVEKTDVSTKKLRLDANQNLSKKSSSKTSEVKNKQKPSDKSSSKRKRSTFEVRSSKSGSFFTNPSSVSSVSFFAQEEFDSSMYHVLRQTSEEELKAREERTEKYVAKQALIFEQGLDQEKELNFLYSNIGEVRVEGEVKSKEKCEKSRSHLKGSQKCLSGDGFLINVAESN